MALFHTTVLDNQIKALPTVDTASGSIATFNTDLTENLVEVKCQIVAKQASGTPSPVNPLPITTYTSLNLSHSGSDTSNPTVYNIPFGQTVANGVLDITTGKLVVTHNIVDLGSLSWTYSTVSKWFYNYTLDIKSGTTNMLSSIYKFEDFTTLYGDITIDNSMSCSLHATPSIVIRNSAYTDATTFKTAMSGVQLVYELKTPIEIQLDSITLQALLNENNIWCDTGDTEVKYLLTVGKKIS